MALKLISAGNADTEQCMSPDYCFLVHDSQRQLSRCCRYGISVHWLISCLVFCVFLFSPTTVISEDLYVAQVAAGADDGSSCENAKSLSWLNNSANWGSGINKVSAADIVHLCGPFTNTLSIAGSGEPGSPVTILFESGAKFSWSVWGDNGAAAIWADAVRHIVIDGGSNGKIESTNNGTALGLQAESVGVAGQQLDDFKVRNLITTNMYVHTPYVTDDPLRYGLGIKLAGTNLSVINCKTSDGEGGIALTFGAGVTTNHNIIGNTILKVNHGITIALAQSLSFPRDIIIASNRIDLQNIYDNDDFNTFHRDGLIWLDESATRGAASNVFIFANYIGPNYGTNPFTTAMLFFNTYYSYQLHNLRIYNNVLDCSQGSTSGGGVSLGGCTNSFIANNTFIDCGILLGSADVFVTNNLMRGLAGGIQFSDFVAPTYTNIPPRFASDYNIFSPVAAGSGQFKFYTGFGAGLQTYNQYVQWTNSASVGMSSNFDHLHSSTNTPLLSGSYVPLASDTVARGQGVNLSAWFTTDYQGATRPVGAWTIGAFDTAPSAPTSLTATPGNQSVTLTWGNDPVADGIHIYGSDGLSGNVIHTNLAAGTTSWTESNVPELICGESRVYQVSLTNSLGSASDIASAAPGCSTVRPITIGGILLSR